MKSDYPIFIFPYEDYYYAYLPDFGWSACSATGDTIEETLESLVIVKKTVIEFLIEKGEEIPKPHSINKFDCVKLPYMILNNE